MYAEDKHILEGTAWLTDSIIQAAQKLLRKEKDLDGFQTPLLGANLQFKQVNISKGFLQVLHIHSNHWITVSNLLSGQVRKKDVYIYDSLMPKKISYSTVSQVCCFMRSPSKTLSFNVVDVMRQRNSHDCGLHALATATDIAFSKDPAKSQWEPTLMRPHLMNCLQQRKMAPFPVAKERRIPFGSRIKTYDDINIHCSCRMPCKSRETDPMIQCDLCRTWFHGRCINININEYKHQTWLCEKCDSLMKS